MTNNIQTSNEKKFFSQVAIHIVFIFIFTLVIGIFSIIMSGVSTMRSEINEDNYYNTSLIYNGPINQMAPTLKSIDSTSAYYINNKLTTEKAKTYVDNTSLVSTDGKVEIDADFVKKGLSYQPSYRTKFYSKYILENKLNQRSFIKFEFPFPTNIASSEISNVTLTVDGMIIEDAKMNLSNDENIITDEKNVSYDYYDHYDHTPNYDSINGLVWEGYIDSNSQINIEVSYHTVGLSLFSYEGIENSKGAQDFNFDLKIKGTRAYNVIEGLSVDNREFGDNEVTISWDKPDLYSKPMIKVSVGEKLNPSVQVSKVYLTMAPIYLAFISILLYLTYKFSKVIKPFDVFLITGLFVLFFPFLHYLSSFTIDPTLEIYNSFKNIGYFSMPLYGAFGIAWIVIGGMKMYLITRIHGFKFAMTSLLPALVLFIGFFPLVVTVPEYSMLLVIIGVIALIGIVIQVRLRMKENI